LPDPRPSNQIDERRAAAVEDGNLEIIDFDRHVVYSEAVQSAEQMLGSSDQDALAHQTGGVTDPRDIFPARRNREKVQTRATKNDAGTRRRRSQADMNRNPAVQPYT